MSIANSNRRIAKNTLYLYMRTLIVMFAMLYTSRIVLESLGVEDLGIYNVVGGIVALLSIFQSSLSKATSRFLNFELGKGSGPDVLRRVFSMSMTIHIIVAFVAILLGETIGLYILKNFTVIPIEKQVDAFVVFHCSLLIFCFHIVRIPYDAVIIAHENMSVYAYLSILEAILQLLSSIILLNYGNNKLFFYAFLMLVSAAILYFCYFVYVKIKFKQYRFSFIWQKNYSVSLLSFSGWNLVTSSANVATQQGVSLLFNNFIGLVANTALGFANQVNGAVGKFVGSFTTAFNPQVVKLCAQQDYEKLHLLMNRASKYSFILVWVMAFPLILNMDFVLHLWLGAVPQYTVDFCRMILVCSVIDATTGVYNTTIIATGKIRNYQICISLSFIIDFCLAVILLKSNLSPILVFGSRILTRGIFNMFIGWYFIRKIVDFDVYKHVKIVWLPIIVTVLITVLLFLTISHNLLGWRRLVLTTILNFIVVSICVYYLIMDQAEKAVLIQLVKKNIFRSI